MIEMRMPRPLTISWTGLPLLTSTSELWVELRSFAACDGAVIGPAECAADLTVVGVTGVWRKSRSAGKLIPRLRVTQKGGVRGSEAIHSATRVKLSSARII